VNRGFLGALFLLLGLALAGQGVGLLVDARTVARDGRTVEATVLSYQDTLYAGKSGRVFIADPLFNDVQALALRPHEPGEIIRVRYLRGDRLLVAEEGAPLNIVAVLVWMLLGAAIVSVAAWSTRALYAEQRLWERLEADLLGR
jgi:hypothetical protein